MTNLTSANHDVWLPADWIKAIAQRFDFAELQTLLQKVDAERDRGLAVFPSSEHIFRAFHLTPFASVRVVILGQDPYHGLGQAHGLSFSVPEGVRIPPSLRNIYRELEQDLGVPSPSSGDLTAWAEQGVLLLNSILTVRESEPGSHQSLGWDRFTDVVIQCLNAGNQPIAFVLWGSFAQKKKVDIDPKKHLVIESVHPSPLSAYRGFFGSRPFSRINQFLRNQGHPAIDFVSFERKESFGLGRSELLQHQK